MKKNVAGSPLWLQTMKNLSSEKAFKENNLVYSPLSIYTALGLLTSGSKGETCNQLLGFLKSQDLDSLNKFCSQLMSSLNETQTQRQLSPLSIANSVWVNESCALKPKFQEVADSVFSAHVQAVDFEHKADEVTEMVNQWVETKTNGIIKNLVQKGSFSEFTMVVLVNALYFKGVWHQGQFDKTLTKNSEFYLPDGQSSVQVPFMTSTEEYQYISRQNGFKVLQLPYKLQRQTGSRSCHQYDDEYDPSTRRFSMYIILPDRRDGLGELIDFSSTDSASFMNQYIPEYMPLKQTGEFKVPKFKITFKFDAIKVLNDMGLVLPFSSEAELTEMVGTSGSISKVIHKCFVEVDEEGTEGASATLIEFEECSMGGDPPSPPPVEDFVADHPFMFIIKDDFTGVLLFTGYVLNPLL
ncbi:serpin-Z2A-like [Papaver somniferum]|uniref:serpin-Z2A-like n=1 Tax=Papaver somniferum TaxID=3469 RepID=UPI000E6F7D48|nr:serpin-Z2A-like [Papaver somniferum]